MDLKENLYVASRLMRSAYLRYRCQTTADIDALARGVASLLPQPVHVFRLEGHYLLPGEGSRLVDPLMAGETVLLAHAGASDLPIAFADRWIEYLEFPQSGLTVTRHLELKSNQALTRPGFLVVLHVITDKNLPEKARHSRIPDKAWRSPIRDNEAAVLEEMGRSQAFSITNLGVSQHVNRQEITVKNLCLLHSRDPLGTPRLSLQETLNERTDALTWTDLQELLHNGSSSKSILDMMLQSKRIDEEKWSYGYSALDYLEEHRLEGPHGIGPAVYASIYDVIWDYHWLELQDYIFRGQFDIRWRQDSSLFRRKLDGSELDVQTLLERTLRTEAFLDELRKRQLELFGVELGEKELLAVAQHYGFETPLLDYSRSLRVAAFFATRNASDLKPGEERIGVIYYMTSTRTEFGIEESRDADMIYGFGNFSLLKEAGIRLGSVQTIEPKIPDEDNRIARQKALFIEGYHVRDLQNIVIDRLYFKQQAGEVFEDTAVGVTKKLLLDDQSRVAKIAEEVKERFKSQEKPGFLLHSTVGATNISGNSIIGSTGEHLFAQVREANDFFKSLRRLALESGNKNILEELGKVFTGYFQASRALADVGVLPTDKDEQKTLDPFEIAVSQLANISGVDKTRLWNSIVGYLPIDREDQPPTQVDQSLQLTPANDIERMALACALYLAGWEHLQFVRGGQARKLTIKAQLALDGYHPPKM